METSPVVVEFLDEPAAADVAGEGLALEEEPEAYDDEADVADDREEGGESGCH